MVYRLLFEGLMAFVAYDCKWLRRLGFQMFTDGF